MGAKIETKTQQYEKKDMLKLMLKFDSEKSQKNRRINRTFGRKGPIFGRSGGKGGRLEAEFRPFPADFK